MGRSGARASMGDSALTAVRDTDAVLYLPAEVREGARLAGTKLAQRRAYSVHGSNLLLSLTGREWPTEADKEEPAHEWLDRIFTMDSFDIATARMRAHSQAPGADGWRGVLVRAGWAPEPVREGFMTALRQVVEQAACSEDYPDNYMENRISLIPKKGARPVQPGEKAGPVEQRARPENTHGHVQTGVQSRAGQSARQLCIRLPRER